ncbi:alpha/beta hydrolase [Rhodoferax sp. U11-2br]|uniref:alpha/beta hydrolase n=1 Tax=Rhodoferax sp. U11-2br TaxID=2838878 RepID=UPI001BEADFAA|nr:alpha/beta hydrolase [Rhodoferax sp. U11-2br]MBT3065664.1 alpha/beta hydrolase [Rhodoferax sp. U11-2br]
MQKIAMTGLLATGLLASCLAVSAPLKTRDVIELWPGSVGPGSEQSPAKLTITERSKVAYWPDRIVTGITRPNLTAFVPDKPNGTVVIAAPGGAYSRIVLDKEAAEMAHWLNPYGVTVLLMQYRLPAEGHVNGWDVPLQDAQRAVRLVRHNAKAWGLDPNKVGFLGASAAGHMGAMLGAKFDSTVYTPVDAADQLSARPDFLMLLYPVISMETGQTHLESRTNLLGKDPSPELIKAYSADQQVSKASPPTFVVLAENDSAVPPANGIAYHNALKALGVPTELHVFKEGEHGFGIRDARQLPVSNWPNLAASWLKSFGLVP